ncbi:nucleic acid dioxygenase ALKBH1 [Ceratitis capitata]|uniref:Alkylated DNA repair protein alkB-1 n=1 Tax=Ceratitis capitata TaxID=7213 RepID=W8BX83_CERCA|nr:nucleic acid dioxygenase ALKBH1 [Ceratitis capitata]
MNKMFKERFKYYKRKSPVPDFSSVIDLDNNVFVSQAHQIELNYKSDVEKPPLGLEPPKKWLCYALNSSGVIIIRNPFTARGQRYWISRCLRDYPRGPNVNNLSPHLFPTEVLDNWWQCLQKCSDKDEVRRLGISLRWATLGYHHDWDSKKYSEERRGNFPEDLASISTYFASILGYKNYDAQAAIVNFYPIGTTLSAHTDHSEPNRMAPLFSFSFGQTAIFLIGGRTREDLPLAVYLRSGDVLVMSGESRLCYHAVPRVMKTLDEPWNDPIPLEGVASIESPRCKKARIEPPTAEPDEENGFDTLLYLKVVDEAFWSPFKIFLNNARININVRQVLNAGESSLPTSEQEELKN